MDQKVDNQDSTASMARLCVYLFVITIHAGLGSFPLSSNSHWDQPAQNSSRRKLTGQGANKLNSAVHK